jgi:hypothetical protein
MGRSVNNTLRTLLLLALLSVAACSTTYFKEADPAGPHAKIRFEAQKGLGGALGGQSVMPLELNGLPPSEWKWSGRQYTVAPGEIKMLVQAYVGKLTGICSVTFNAEDAKTYLLAPVNADEAFDIVVYGDNMSEITRCKAPKTVAPTNTVIPIFIPS